MQIKELTSKEVRQLLDKIKEYYGITDENFLEKISKEYVWYITKQNKIYIAKRNLVQLTPLLKNIQNFGIYIIKIEKDGLRFSIEGSQIFGPYITKNVVGITKDQLYQWFQGMDLEIDIKENNVKYVVLKCGEDFIGSGKLKNGKIINYLPKNRRIYI